MPIKELWEADQKSLLKLPDYPFPVFHYQALAVNKYGFAVIDTNRYGLSPSLAGRTVSRPLREFIEERTDYYFNATGEQTVEVIVARWEWLAGG